MSSSYPGGAQGSGILGGFGDILSGVGTLVEGKQQKNMAEYNAKIYEQQAQAERSSAALLAEQKNRLIKSQLGKQTALYGKSGVKMSGSPLEVMLDSMTNANLDLAIDKYNSDVKAHGYESSAAMSRFEGKNKQKLS